MPNDVRVLTAYCQPANGPGWRNSPFYIVVYVPSTGKIEEICLQPNEQTREMLTLYEIGSVVQKCLVSAAEAYLRTTKSPQGE